MKVSEILADAEACLAELFAHAHPDAEVRIAIQPDQVDLVIEAPASAEASEPANGASETTEG